MEDNIHGCFTPRFVARWWGWACLVRLDTPPQNMPFWWSKIYNSIEIPHQLAPLRLVVSEERGKSGFWKSGWWEAMVQAVDEFLEPILILWKAIPAGFYHTFPFPFAASTRPKDGRNWTCYFTSCLHFDHYNSCTHFWGLVWLLMSQFSQ